MKKLFKTTQNILITSPTNFPSGIAVKTEKSIYWIKDNKRFKLISDRAAESWKFTTVNAMESALTGIKLAGKLGFRDGSLIKNIADGKIYIVSQNKLRHIVNPDVFNKFGLNKEWIVEVSQNEIDAHEIGDKIE